MKQKITINLDLYETEKGDKGFVRYYDVKKKKILTSAIGIDIFKQIKQMLENCEYFKEENQNEEDQDQENELIHYE